jgi:hypothetical protein
MGYGEIVCVCVCVCVCHTHSESFFLSLSLPLSLSLSLSRFLLQLLRTLSQCTDSHTLAHTHTQHHSNTRATCRHAALLEEALIRRVGTTPRAHHLPPPLHIHKSTRLPRAHAHIQAHSYAYAYGSITTHPHSHIQTHTCTRFVSCI